MAVAYVVLAHRAPGQVGRLVARLLAGGGDQVLLHVDRRAPEALHAAIVAALPDAPGLRLVPRVPSAWSSWGTVEATLAGFRMALDGTHGTPTHVVAMSGQDYLLRPAGEIARFLADHADVSFAPAWRLPSEHLDRDGGLYRLRYWHRPVGRRRAWIPIPRAYPTGLAPHAGPAFMALDRASAERLLAFGDARPEVVRFHRHVWAPDEHYVQTALWSCVPDPARVLLDENLWHIEWPPPPPPAKHPRTYLPEDADRLIAAAREGSEAGGPSRAKLFARKFDADAAPGLLDRLDSELRLADGEHR